jgi:hypothetical protein
MLYGIFLSIERYFHTTFKVCDYYNTEALGSRYFICVLYRHLQCLSSGEMLFTVYPLPSGRGLLCFSDKIICVDHLNSVFLKGLFDFLNIIALYLEIFVKNHLFVLFQHHTSYFSFVALIHVTLVQ